MGSFRFKKFEIKQDRCAMKVGTDGVLLGAWASGGKRILDIGSGTGLLALMMAQRFAEARVVGVDIDEAACLQACENVKDSPFADRVEIKHGRIQDFGTKENGTEELTSSFDAVVSNPPFFVNSMKNPDIKRSMARHTDSLSFRDLFMGVHRLMAEDGVFSTIVPKEVLEQFCSEAYMLGFYVVKKCAIKTVEKKASKRYLLAFSRSRKNGMEETVETMMDKNGNRSSWYAKITDDFYL